MLLRPLPPLFRSCPLVLTVLLTVGSAAPAIAQSSNATLQGTVTDASGGVLPGVTVKLASLTTGLSRDAVTNAAGVYVFNFLPAGSYGISAELFGFKTVRHEQIRLEIGQNLGLDLSMEIGSRRRW